MIKTLDKPIVALEIGSTKVACAIGLSRDHLPGVELLGSSVVAYPTLPEAWPSDPLMIGRTVEAALEATALTGDFSQAQVAIAHPALRSELVHVTMALADEPINVRLHDLERLRTCALNQALGVDREALVVERLGCSGNGFEGVRDPRGLPATHLRAAFHLVTMPLAVRRVVTQAVESAGLEIVRLTHTLPALLASLPDKALASRRLLLIDVGGLATDAGLFVDGLWQRAEFLPWGGLSCAMEIAKTLRVTLDQALTWSLEGLSSRKKEVSSLFRERWRLLKEAIDRLLTDQPLPAAVLINGRGGLVDGFVEWVERETGIPASLCRNPRANLSSDLSRQLSLGPVLGLLEAAALPANGVPPPTSVLNRLLYRTRTLLTEYF